MPVSSQTLYITPVLTDDGWRFNSDGVYPDTPAPNYTPLFIDDFSDGSVDAAYPLFDGTTIYADDQPTLSGKSIKVVLDARIAPACGNGNVYYAGRPDLDVDIPVGKTIWFKMRRYFPTTHTWAYCYGPSDQAAAEACDGGGAIYDGNPWLKDMVLAPVTGFSRIYVQPTLVRRSNEHPVGMRVITEVNAQNVENETATFPLGQWFNTQLMVKVDNTGAGIMRVWLDDELVLEKISENVSAVDNAIREWGIGNYYNGIPYIDGVSMTAHYWVKDIVIATDVDGYGAPNTTDAGGNVYIAPSITPSDFA